MSLIRLKYHLLLFVCFVNIHSQALATTPSENINDSFASEVEEIKIAIDNMHAVSFLEDHIRGSCSLYNLFPEQVAKKTDIKKAVSRLCKNEIDIRDEQYVYLLIPAYLESFTPAQVRELNHIQETEGWSGLITRILAAGELLVEDSVNKKEGSKKLLNEPPLMQALVKFLDNKVFKLTLVEIASKTSMPAIE